MKTKVIVWETEGGKGRSATDGRSERKVPATVDAIPRDVVRLARLVAAGPALRVVLAQSLARVDAPLLSHPCSHGFVILRWSWGQS